MEIGLAEGMRRRWTVLRIHEEDYQAVVAETEDMVPLWQPQKIYSNPSTQARLRTALLDYLSSNTSVLTDKLPDDPHIGKMLVTGKLGKFESKYWIQTW
ncbi:hypothetical protein BDR05DRAFT_961310 [Suillus weaverae]|nr:hypothetical protein BDR05DRAFT_961310 [Suillus weaverae]